MSSTGLCVVVVVKMEDKTSHFYADVNDLVERDTDCRGKGRVVEPRP